MNFLILLEDVLDLRGTEALEVIRSDPVVSDGAFGEVCLLVEERVLLRELKLEL